MKIKLLIASILCLTFMGCGNTPHQGDIFSHLFDKYNQEMRGEFGLHAMQHRITTDPKIRKIAVDFYDYKERETLQARFLIHQVTESLLTRLNGCSYIRSHFDHFPLTATDLEVSISFIDPKTHKSQAFDQLVNVSLINGQIYYSTYSKEKESLEPIHSESYISQKARSF